MRKLTKNKLILLIALAVILLIIASFSLKDYLTRPQNLGPNLEYLGKRHTGCPLPLPLGYILLCSSEPGEEYYFGTDMSEEELRGYFRGATPITSENLVSGTAAEYNWIDVGFTIQNRGFTFFFYDDKDGVLDTYPSLGKTSKKYIISISNEDYQEAKNAL